MTRVNYPVGDFLIRVKNAARAGRREFELDNTKFIKEVAGVLKKAGYLDKVTVKDGILHGSLAFHKKEPVLLNLKLVSKPGLRVYKSVDELEAKKGSSIYVLSTPEGVMSTKEAVKRQVGGEVIVEVW